MACPQFESNPTLFCRILDYGFVLFVVMLAIEVIIKFVKWK